MASLGDLGKGLRNEAQAAQRMGAIMLRRCALGVLRNVVMATPVGNPTIWQEPEKAPAGYVGGRARANWLVAIGSPAPGPVETIDAAGASTIAKGGTTIKGATQNSVIHLTNNLPYIQPLNDGHSHQAPVGFIETSIEGGMRAGTGAGLSEKE